jgi:hypothetical protein
MSCVFVHSAGSSVVFVSLNINLVFFWSLRQDPRCSSPAS